MSAPHVVEGSAAIRSPSPAFLAAFAKRVDTGLLLGVPARRCRYETAGAHAGGLSFRAVDWASALYVGLNDVDLTPTPGGRIAYVVRFPRWAGFALALCGAFGLAFAAFILLFDLRDYIATHPGPQFLGLSVDASVAVAWSMAAFWGFVWPWLLIVLHRRPVRRLIERLIADVDDAATPAAS